MTMMTVLFSVQRSWQQEESRCTAMETAYSFAILILYADISPAERFAIAS
jgi:hypothetical protein